MRMIASWWASREATGYKAVSRLGAALRWRVSPSIVRKVHRRRKRQKKKKERGASIETLTKKAPYKLPFEILELYSATSGGADADFVPPAA